VQSWIKFMGVADYSITVTLYLLGRRRPLLADFSRYWTLNTQRWRRITVQWTLNSSSCRRWKKDLEQTWDTCLSRLGSDEMMTRAWSVTVTVTVTSCMTGLLPPIIEKLRLEPIQSSSVLSALSLSRFAIENMQQSCLCRVSSAIGGLQLTVKWWTKHLWS